MQAQDHPVLLTVPETLYLKCLILELFKGHGRGDRSSRGCAIALSAVW